MGDEPMAVAAGFGGWVDVWVVLRVWGMNSVRCFNAVSLSCSCSLTLKTRLGRS